MGDEALRYFWYHTIGAIFFVVLAIGMAYCTKRLCKWSCSLNVDSPFAVFPFLLGLVSIGFVVAAAVECAAALKIYILKLV